MERGVANKLTLSRCWRLVDVVATGLILHQLGDCRVVTPIFRRV